jgi:O-antigen ligase
VFGSSLDPLKRPHFPAVIQGNHVDLTTSIDNTYIRELTQTGLAGLVALSALLLGVLVEPLRRALSATGNQRTLGSALAAAQVVVVVIALTVGTLSFSQIGIAYWLVVGAGIALGSTVAPRRGSGGRACGGTG